MAAYQVPLHGPASSCALCKVVSQQWLQLVSQGWGRLPYTYSPTRTSAPALPAVLLGHGSSTSCLVRPGAREGSLDHPGRRSTSGVLALDKQPCFTFLLTSFLSCFPL